jgi:hypothetical protein
VSSPDPSLEALKEGGWREVASINQALAEGRIDEDGWHEAMASLIKPAYLAGKNPYAQAGHSGDAVTWEASRGFIAEAFHRSGAFLDVGCASGVLMESAQRWGARRNLHIEPYGMDIVPEFVSLARRRLPHWADRIHVGNIRSWEPATERFDFVLIRPEYAPAKRRVELVRHVPRPCSEDRRSPHCAGRKRGKGVEACGVQHHQPRNPRRWARRRTASER